VLTLNTVVKNETGYINIDRPVIFFNWWRMSIGATTYGWVVAQTPAGTAYRLFPLKSFYVGEIHSRGNVFKFGLVVQIVYPQYGKSIFYYAIPVILADTNDDGFYDTVCADLSTVYYIHH